MVQKNLDVNVNMQYFSLLPKQLIYVLISID